MTDSPAPPHHASILIVEDDRTVLDITSFVLETAGYPVLTAMNADEALAVLALHPEVGLVLTDVNMPGRMDGIDLVHAVRRSGTSVRCVVVSGDALHAAERLDGAAPFLAKPYDRRSLLQAVGAALGTG
ncbi:response regulator [Luteibacter aegosomatissinici]|uniref:response regulator n=1 Tax=Luteibacter aegosomatissinici TaxID=2911539 RepID=UPI001FF92AE5|nr:response regulator [Luteibacter aegosomatissinici]UPG93631.1 response regulator [Luteibacter aegosomatissinici]